MSGKTGSIGGGNTFPGVTRPLGMIKLGPDLYNGRDSYSGYQPDGNFIGFSMLHESGTGGAPKYGVVAQMPVVGEIPNPLADISQSRGADDVTEVGYYRSTTQNGIEIELGAASRAGFYQYTFPEGQGDPAIVVDVSHVLKSYRGMGLEQHYLGGGISVHKEGEQGHLSYRGYGRYDNVGSTVTARPCIFPQVRPGANWSHRVGTKLLRGLFISADTSTSRRRTRHSWERDPTAKISIGMKRGTRWISHSTGLVPSSPSRIPR